MDSILTLTTDFGTASPYVAALKGVVLSISPTVRLVDLSHAIGPQDIRHAAFFLASALPYFPPQTIHVIVIDPGVGTARALLYVEVANQRLLAPDNGCWTLLGEPTRVIRLVEPRFWRQPVSATFHGRDILAPVAAHLSLGVPAEELGPQMRAWQEFHPSAPTSTGDRIEGEVAFVDEFGNLIINVRGEIVAETSAQVAVGGVRVSRFVRTYGEAAPGTLVALTGSTGLLEVAVVNGSAARQLECGVGTPVTIQRTASLESGPGVPG